MNAHAQPSYLDMHHSHLSGGQHSAPQTVTSGMSHYSHYGQPPLLQPGPGHYSPAQSSYGSYGYSNGVASPQTATHAGSGGLIGSQVPPQLLPLPAMAPTGQALPGAVGGGQGYSQASMTFDATGQIAPAGMKPRVTATLWEDEGSLCFQVEAKGVCVARREDNHMINGTKLLNVAGMTRGRRDGILKSEKMRHVVKIGPMHLKGVWIPFDRALDFANKEKITELLYPLFVHNIGALLYHPTNSTRTNQVMAAAERRRIESTQQEVRGPPSSQTASLHHHHSMHNPMGSHLSGPPSSIAPHPGVNGRPSLDRAHTFPTPPTSAGIMGMGGQESTYWHPQQQMSGPPGQATAVPLAIDTGLSNARSMPTTPATTPPGNALHSMQQYQNGPGYDGGRTMYSAPPPPPPHPYAQHHVTTQSMARYGPAMGSHQQYGVKNEMGPPVQRGPGSGAEGEHHVESKGGEGLLSSHGTGNEAGGQEEEAVHEHDHEYGHGSGTSSYDSARGPYSYGGGGATSTGGMHGEPSHLSPEMTGSPGANHSGRGTPRTNAGSQATQWTGGYHTPPRTQSSSSSNLFNVMSSNESAGSNGSSGPASYGSASGLPSVMHAGGYAAQAAPAPHLNGTPSSSNKRVREMDDDGSSGSRDVSRGPASPGESLGGLKRRKTMRENSLPGVGATSMASSIYTRDAGVDLNRTRSAIVQRR